MDVNITTKFSATEPNSLLRFDEGDTQPNNCYLSLSFYLDSEPGIDVSLSAFKPAKDEWGWEVPPFTNKGGTRFLHAICGVINNSLSTVSDRTSIIESVTTFCDSNISKYEAINWKLATDWVRGIVSNPVNEYESSISAAVKDLKSYSPSYIQDLRNMIVSYSYLVTPQVVVVGLLEYLVYLRLNGVEVPLEVMEWTPIDPTIRYSLVVYLNVADGLLFVNTISMGNRGSGADFLTWKFSSLLNKKEVNDRLERIAPHAKKMLEILSVKRDINPIVDFNEYSDRYKKEYKLIQELVMEKGL